MDLLVAEVLWGWHEVASQLADLVHVSLDGLGRAVAELKVFDQASPERSHGEDSRGQRGQSPARSAAAILPRESPGRKSFSPAQSLRLTSRRGHGKRAPASAKGPHDPRVYRQVSFNALVQRPAQRVRLERWLGRKIKHKVWPSLLTFSELIMSPAVSSLNCSGPYLFLSKVAQTRFASGAAVLAKIPHLTLSWTPAGKVALWPAIIAKPIQPRICKQKLDAKREIA
jgi:hypothetical protein